MARIPATTADSTGACAIRRQVTDRALEPPRRRAVAAAVVHSSMCRRVRYIRSRVRTMASTASQASIGTRSRLNNQRAACIASPGAAAHSDAPPNAPTSAPSAPVSTGVAEISTPTAVQATGEPGKRHQAPRKNSSMAGAYRLRRMLSRIFQRSRADSRLGTRVPSAAGTRLPSQGSNCQSPRIQRCWRQISPRYEAGASS